MEMKPGVAKQAALARPTIAGEEEARQDVVDSGHVLIERRTGSPVDGSQKWFSEFFFQGHP